MATKPLYATEYKISNSEFILIAPSDITLDQAINPRTADGSEITEESVADMVADLRANGQLQNVILRKLPDRSLTVIAGQRRVLAAQVIHRDDPEFRLKADVMAVNDEEAFVVGIRENAFRKDISLLSKALSMRKLMDNYGWDKERVAELYQCGSHHVYSLIRILGLPAAVRKRIAAGELTTKQAEALLSLDEAVAVQIVEEASAEVAEANAAKGLKTSRMVTAMRGKLLEHGVTRPRKATDLIKLIAGRMDPVSLALVAYLKGVDDEGQLFEALDHAEPPALSDAAYMTEDGDKIEPVAKPAKGKVKAKGKHGKTARPKLVRVDEYSPEDETQMEADEAFETVEESEASYA